MELTKKQKDFQAICQLKDMKVGEPIRQINIDGARHFFGDIFDKLGEPKVLGSVTFDSAGKAIIDGDLIASCEIIEDGDLPDA